MPVPCSSPINRPTKRPEPGLSPGARSMPGARKDSVPEQKPARSPAVGAHGEPPEPGATPGGSVSSPRSDAVDGPVAAHLVRHAMLRRRFGE
jgi:hypothetical protein